MRRWVWKVLLMIAVMAALTVGAAAEEVKYPASGNNSIVYDLTDGVGTVMGPVNKSNITTARIAAEVNGVKITKINENAFNGCGQLATVEIGTNVEMIGPSAFNSCPILETVLFTDKVSSIGSYAFANCRKLNRVVLPTILTTIESGTFANCTALTSIYIANVETIGSDAFSGTGVKYLHRESETGLNQADDPALPVHHASRIPGLRTEPTCTGEGNQAYTYSCATCKASFNFSRDQVIPAKGHTPKNIDMVEPTCITPGSEAGTRCEVCNSVISGLKTIDPDPTKHASAPVPIPDVPATCTESGSTGGERCPDCFAVTTEPAEDKPSGHEYSGGKVSAELISDATCTESGLTVKYRVCDVCEEVEKCETCEELKGDPDKEADYIAHVKSGAHAIDEPTAKGHTPGAPAYVVTVKPTCTDKGKEEWRYVCQVCGEPILDDLPDDVDDHEPRELEATGHTPKEKVRDEDKSTPGTCLTDGENVYKETTCTVCKASFTPDPEEVKAPGSHTYEDIDENIVKDSTCMETGLKEVGAKECSVCGDKIPPTTEIIPKKPHNWGTPVKDPDPGEGKEDKAPTCGEEGVAYVIVTCQNTDVGCTEAEHREIIIPATGLHDWGEWETKEPTLTQPGEKKRVCKTCEKEDIIVLPATGDSSDPDDPDAPTEPEQPATYRVDVVQASNGTTSVNRTTAQSGDRVTITISPASDYELDMLRVISADGKVLNPDSLGSGQYRFTMPAANVEVRATFSRKSSSSWSGSNWASAPGEGTNGDARRTTDVMPTQNPSQSVPKAGASEQIFRDISTGYWAAGEINWANQMGYMNGTAGRFNPDGNITHQQMWMVLARITGNQPANMTEARRWAVEHSFADGSSPTAAVSRHQLVTALYRCAHLMGSTNRNTTSLAGYADSRTVPTVARDAFSWAVANGIVSGTASGRLDPNGTLTRAQFAVILYRYSQRI